MKLSTEEKYREIVDSSGARSNEQLISWAQNRLSETLAPIGTSLTTRAAVKHRLREMGYGLDDLEALLPPPKGIDPAVTPPLTPDQLELFAEVVTELPDPASVILQLLLLTGLRIGEALSISSFDGERIYFNDRVIVLDYATKKLLKDQALPFAITQHGVRVHTRKLAELLGAEQFSPQTLRSTYAVISLQRGMSLVELQSRLGHTSIQTTQRYLTLLHA